MKTRTLVAILIIVLVAPIIAESGIKKKRVSDEELTKAYTGTWIHQDATYFQKYEFIPDGKWQEYVLVDSDRISEYGEHTIIDQWKDKDGNIFFETKFKCLHCSVYGYLMVKTNNSKNTLEMLIRYGDNRVETWDPDSLLYNYRIYYRQE
jgi:hypothetical protein